MFGSVILEVFIGLFLLYLILSLVTTAVQEALAAVLKMRAATLAKGVKQLLQDTQHSDLAAKLTHALYAHPALARLYSGKPPTGRGVLRGRGPSYMPSDSFAIALLDGIRRLTSNDAASVAPISAEDLFTNAGKIVATLPDGDLKTKLTLLVGDITATERHIQRRAQQAQKAIEDWFDQSMDRVSGWYKRKAQCFGIVIGFLVALLLNADTINVADKLWTNQTLRSSLVQVAEQYVPSPESGETETDASAAARDPEDTLVGKDFAELVDLAKLAPIGWQDLSQVARPPKGAPPDVLGLFALQPGQTWGRAVIGWLATGFAISLGAGFWFDVLGRLIQLRASGRRLTDTAERR